MNTCLVAAALPLARIARRMGAAVYEALLLVAIVFVASFLLLPLVTPGHAGAVDQLAIPSLPARVALFFLLFTGVAWYCVWSWTSGRRTLPMKTWRLALVQADGNPLTRKAALLRYLAAWIGPGLAVVAYVWLQRYGLGAHAAWLVALNFLWAFVDPERQFLHDRVAGTRLVVA